MIIFFYNRPTKLLLYICLSMPDNFIKVWNPDKEKVVVAGTVRNSNLQTSRYDFG